MTDCNNLDEQARQAQEELDNLKRMRAKMQANLQHLKEPKVSKEKWQRKILTKIDGTEVSVDPVEWARKAEDDLRQLEEGKVQELVSGFIENKEKPLGRTGQSINYGRIPPTKANVAAVLNLMGQKWQKTKGGINHMRPFTQEVATHHLIDFAKRTAKDPRLAVERLTKDLGKIGDLAISTYSAAKYRWESAVAYADALEDAANIIEETGVLPDINLLELSNIGKWAHTFEQLDTFTRRKFGQALQSYQKDMDLDLDLVDFTKQSSDLTLDDITGESLLAQVIDHVDKGDHRKLRSLAISKRISGLREVELNEPVIYQHMRNQLHYKKANMFSSIWSWGLRNPVSGIMTSADFYMRDILQTSLSEGFGAANALFGYTNRKMVEGWSDAWNNARGAWRTGRQRMSGRTVKETSPELLESAKLANDNAINQAWDLLFTDTGTKIINNYKINYPKGLKLPLKDHSIQESIASRWAWLTLFNGSVRNLTGRVGEKLAGNDAWYFPEFRALSAVDEGVRTMAGIQAIHSEAFAQGIQVARGTLLPSKNWLDRLKGGTEGGGLMGPSMEKKSESVFAQEYADEAVKNWLFSGKMTDEDLRKFRQKEVGMPAGQNMTDDEIRIKVFNDLNGVPNQANMFGALAKDRGDKVTFTGKFDAKGPLGKVGQAFNFARQDPIVGGQMPVFTTMVKGLGWAISKDIYFQTFKQAAVELNNLSGRGNKALTKRELAQERADVVSSIAIATMMWMLAEAGVINGPPPTDPRERENWLRHNVPYSISIGALLGKAGIGKAQEATEELGTKIKKISARSIEFFDIAMTMGHTVQYIKDGFLPPEIAKDVQPMFIDAYRQLLKSKNGLKTIMEGIDLLQNVDGNHNAARYFAAQNTGNFPFSGLIGNFDRAFEAEQAGEKFVPRRLMSNDEIVALSKDPTHAKLMKITDFINKSMQDYVGFTVKDIPFLDDVFTQPTEKDSLGIDTKATMLGFGGDRAMPFIQLEKDNTKLARWMTRHGITFKPNPDGKITIGEKDYKKRIQLTRDEEKEYRAFAYSIKGELPIAVVLGKTRSFHPEIGSMDQIVRGSTLIEALNKLRQSPKYNDALEGDPSSPSPAKNRFYTRGERTQMDEGYLLKPVEWVYNYYYEQAKQQLIRTNEDVKNRYLLLLKDKAKQRLERGEFYRGRL